MCKSQSALTSADTLRMIAHVFKTLEEEKDWLSKLDSACGDGDHGVSISRGCSAVAAQLPNWSGLSAGELFRHTGTTLISAVGGAAGPLLGTFFVEAGRSAGSAEAIGTSDLASMVHAGLAGVQKRGGAQPGEKTMVDALVPAAAALDSAADTQLPIGRAIKMAAEAARAGAESTREMVARHGKARYLGDRALGHPDPGAFTIVTILEAMGVIAAEND